MFSQRYAFAQRRSAVARRRCMESSACQTTTLNLAASLSNGIVAYIEELFPTPSLQPTTPQGRARMNQWISAVNSYYYPHMIYSERMEALPTVQQLRATHPRTWPPIEHARKWAVSHRPKY